MHNADGIIAGVKTPSSIHCTLLIYVDTDGEMQLNNLKYVRVVHIPPEYSLIRVCTIPSVAKLFLIAIRHLTVLPDLVAITFVISGFATI